MWTFDSSILPVGDFFYYYYYLFVFILLQNVIKRNIKMSTKMTAITAQFSPIKSHRWAHIWRGGPANTQSLSILPNKHLGPCPTSYCFIRLYCEGREADAFFLKKKRYIAYIYLFIYIRLHITVSLHLCLILSRLISQIKLVTFHFIVRFFFFLLFNAVNIISAFSLNNGSWSQKHLSLIITCIKIQPWKQRPKILKFNYSHTSALQTKTMINEQVGRILFLKALQI